MHSPGNTSTTVLLCQLSYMSHEENMAGLEPAPFEGTVVFTTGEGVGVYFVTASDCASPSSCGANPAPVRKPVFLRAGATLIKSAICSSSQRFGTVRLV